jgi:argininosuccinate lyase
LVEKDIFKVLTLDGSIKSRDQAGGTAPSQVRKAIKLARKGLS